MRRQQQRVPHEEWEAISNSPRHRARGVGTPVFRLIMMEWWELGLPPIIDYRFSLVNSLCSLQERGLLCLGRHYHQGACYLWLYKILIRSTWLWISQGPRAISISSRSLISLKKCVIIFHVPSSTPREPWVGLVGGHLRSTGRVSLIASLSESAESLFRRGRNIQA